MGSITIVTDNEEMKKKIQEEADNLIRDLSVLAISNHIAKKYKCAVNTVHLKETTVLSCYFNFPLLCMKSN